MAPPSFVPQQPENTSFLKELQRKENKSKDEFLGSLLSDEKISKDHVALKHSSSSSSSGGGTSKLQDKNPVADCVAKAVDDSDIYTQLSVNLWKRVNAGYLVPRRPPTGVMRSVFTYDQNLVDHQSMEFHRKRDFYSEYNEAAARFKLVHGNKKPLSKSKRAGKAGEDATAANGRLSTPPVPLAESAGANKSLDAVQPSTTNNANATNSNTNQGNQNGMSAIDTKPTDQGSPPASTTTQSKPAEPS